MTDATVRLPGALPVFSHFLALRRDPLGFLASLPAHGDIVQIQVGPAPARLPEYAEVMTEEIDDATSSRRDGQVIDVLACLKATTAQVTAATMFRAALAPVTLREVADDFTVFTVGVGRRMFMPPWLSAVPTPGNRRYNRARTRLRTGVDDVIAEHRTSDAGHKDLLSVLLAARDDEAVPGGDGQALSDVELYEQILSFFLAGIESTAIALAWALHLLGLTGRIITEALRLYPPAWLVTRTATTDTRLGGRPVAAGTTVAFSPYILHHRPDLHPAPGTRHPGNSTPTGGQDGTRRLQHAVP